MAHSKRIQQNRYNRWDILALHYLMRIYIWEFARSEDGRVYITLVRRTPGTDEREIIREMQLEPADQQALKEWL